MLEAEGLGSSWRRFRGSAPSVALAVAAFGWVIALLLHLEAAQPPSFLVVSQLIAIAIYASGRWPDLAPIVVTLAALAAFVEIGLLSGVVLVAASGWFLLRAAVHSRAGYLANHPTARRRGQFFVHEEQQPPICLGDQGSRWVAYIRPLAVVGFGLVSAACVVSASTGAWISESYSQLVTLDGHMYLTIARNGPQLVRHEWPFSTVGWFPGYPLLVRSVRTLVPDWDLAAIATTTISVALAFLFFDKWMISQGFCKHQRTFTLVLVSVYPFGFFMFGVAYAEATYLALAIACFLFLELRYPVAAGLCAALAATVRPTGATLVLALCIACVAYCRSENPRQYWRWISAPLLAAFGTAAYGFYCWWRWNDFFLYIRAQHAIAPHLNVLQPRTWLMTDTLWDVVISDHVPLDRLVLAAQMSIVVVVIASVPSVYRRLGTVYAGYVATVAAVVVGTTPATLSAGRYMLAAFPVAALVGSWMARHPRVGVPLLVVLWLSWVLLFREFLVGSVAYAR